VRLADLPGPSALAISAWPLADLIRSRKVPLALRCSAPDPDLGFQPLEVVRRYLTEQDSQKIGYQAKVGSGQSR